MSISKISRRELTLGIVATAIAPDCARAKTVPVDLNIRGQFAGIIDLYQENDPFDLAEAKRLGVTAVVHGTHHTHHECAPDRKYAERKRRARDLEMLWGAYTMITNEPADAQLDRLFAIEDGSDGTTLMALDWEPNGCGAASYERLRELVQRFRERRGFYPVVYGSPFFDRPEIRRGNALLRQCPLWYANYSGRDAPQTPIPSHTWSDYTLWQLDDEKRLNGAPYRPDVLFGADWSKFKGTAAELVQAWPFRRT